MHTIVVGAGIAGLWTAEQLALRGDRVTLLEKADRLGGRILTSSIGLEIGAGRISTKHRRTLELLDRFGLQTFPLPTGELWKGLGEPPQPSTFLDTWGAFIATAESLDPDVLGSHTLRSLAERTLGPELTERILQQFGFRAETEVLRADLGIKAFRGEMGAAQFVGVKGGLSLLIDALERVCRVAGVNIRTDMTVTDVRGKGPYTVHTTHENLDCDRVILALPSEALRHLPSMRLPLLKHLRMEPLTRIYAKFATPWPFKKLVTNSPLRFIIPIVPELGLVMISYTESQDTKAFKGLRGITLIAALQSELLKLFPELVAQILWASAYEWSHGCTYWLPGAYDPATESKKALQPFSGKSIHLCNESFSLRQAWIEGSMDHAAELIELITRIETTV